MWFPPEGKMPWMFSPPSVFQYLSHSQANLTAIGPIVYQDSDEEKHQDSTPTDDYFPHEREKQIVDHKKSTLKNKYSDTELKPDSSLPPVIWRRNQNRRKQLAAVSIFLF